MQHLPLNWWNSEFPVAPVGYALRSHLSDHWTRFHSLPDSKRYASNDSEWKVLQNRHIAVANILFPEGEPIYIYRSRLSEKRLRGREKHQLAGRQLREQVLLAPTHAQPNGDDDCEIHSVRALISKWQPDFFITLLKLVASDKEWGIALVSPQTKNIYCPYDGGLDVFSFTITPSELEDRYSEWQSSRIDRL